MTCVPYNQWIAANSACNAARAGISVKGIGYVRTGVAGLGDLAIASDPNDPCTLAAQAPCPMGSGCPAACPPGSHSFQLMTAPGSPAVCICQRDKPLPPVVQPSLAPVPAASPVVPVTASASSTGGFSRWGLLAALAAGGTAIYLVTRKKKAA